jgi:hypothetical protein
MLTSRLFHLRPRFDCAGFHCARFHCAGFLAALLILISPCMADQGPDEPIFSGPQVGEELPSFSVRKIGPGEAGQGIDLVEQAGDGPLLLVFVHDVNRQSVGLVRLLTAYAQTRAADGLTTGVIFLHGDATEAEALYKRIRHALTPEVTTAVSLDGIEGPGSLGLNRHGTLTVLVAKRRQVTANFALIQPSLQVDLQKIVAAVVEATGGSVPSLQELLKPDPGMAEMLQRERGSASPETVRNLLRPLIDLQATPEAVAATVAQIEQHMEREPTIKAEIGRIARTIVDSGKLANYGTAPAQAALRDWAQRLADNPRDREPTP